MAPSTFQEEYKMPVTKAEMEGREIESLIPDLEPVLVRVLKRGHGKVSTGNHHPVTGDELYAQGDTFSIAKNIADDLEDLGYVEIQEAAPKRGPGRPPKAQEGNEEGADG